MQSKLIEYIIAETCNYFEIPLSDFKKVYSYTPKNIILAKKLAVRLSLDISKERGAQISLNDLSTFFNASQQKLNFYKKTISDLMDVELSTKAHYKAIKEKINNKKKTFLTLEPFVVISEVCDARGILLREYFNDKRSQQVNTSRQIVLHILNNYSRNTDGSCTTKKQLSETFNINIYTVRDRLKTLCDEITFNKILKKEVEDISNKILKKYSHTTKSLYIENKIEELYQEYKQLKIAN